MKWILMVIMLMILMGCELDSSSEAEKAIELTPYLSVSSANAGDDIDLQIRIDECSQPIFGLCLQLEYDGSYLSFDNESEITTGDIFPDNSLAFIQAENGVVHISFTLQQGEESIENTGILCGLTFHCENAGTTRLSIIQDEINAYDEAGNMIECEYQVSQEADLEIN